MTRIKIIAHPNQTDQYLIAKYREMDSSYILHNSTIN